MTISGELLREIMRGVPSPVGVLVTAVDSGYRGMTASSMTSVSLAPALISFNVRTGSQFDVALQGSQTFTYNLLAADQRATALHFAASGLTAAAQFADTTLRTETDGAAWLPGVVSWLHCREIARHRAGDHEVVIGAVTSARRLTDASPLVIYQGELRPVDDDD